MFFRPESGDCESTACQFYEFYSHLLGLSSWHSQSFSPSCLGHAPYLDMRLSHSFADSPSEDAEAHIVPTTKSGKVTLYLNFVKHVLSYLLLEFLCKTDGHCVRSVISYMTRSCFREGVSR